MTERRWGIEELQEEMGKIVAQRREREIQVAELAAAEKAFKVVMDRLSRSAAVSKADHPTSPELMEFIERFLAEVGQPVHRKQILRHVISLGLHIRGQDPINNMTAHMSNDARFESTKGDGMWGLTEWAQGKTPNGWINRLNGQPADRAEEKRNTPAPLTPTPTHSAVVLVD